MAETAIKQFGLSTAGKTRTKAERRTFLVNPAARTRDSRVEGEASKQIESAIRLLRKQLSLGGSRHHSRPARCGR